MDEEFDFVVVGAGSAGCVVAGRLAKAGHTVLLLEAGGPDSNPWIHIPLGYARLYANPSINWCYTSEPEPELNGRRLFQPRGKVLGGTGSINGMIYVRGQREDFDGWAALGCEGWGYDDVLPYFKKAEHQQRGADRYHGADGPLWVSDLPFKNALPDAFIEAARRNGAPLNDDFNGEKQDGAGYVQATTRNGRRWSTAAGYLRAIGPLASLKVGHPRDGQAGRGGRRPGDRRCLRDRGERSRRPRPARGDPLRAGPTTRRNSCICPASVRPRICRRWAFRSCSTVRGSAPTCRTISVSAWNTAAPSR